MWGLFVGGAGPPLILQSFKLPSQKEKNKKKKNPSHELCVHHKMEASQSVPKNNGVGDNFVVSGQRRRIMLVLAGVPALAPRRR